MGQRGKDFGLGLMGASMVVLSLLTFSDGYLCHFPKGTPRLERYPDPRSPNCIYKSHRPVAFAGVVYGLGGAGLVALYATGASLRRRRFDRRRS